MRATSRAEDEIDRQVRRLYQVAYATHRLGNMLRSPDASPATVAYATTRVPRGLSAGRRLLALPGVSDHPETPYARSFLNQAERELQGPTPVLLRLVHAAHEVATRADASDDDMRYVLFRDIEDRCRYLLRAASIGRAGWTSREYASIAPLQRWAARWGLDPAADGRDAAVDWAMRPEAVAEWARQDPRRYGALARDAATRAAVRARCASGIRCVECLSYGHASFYCPGGWWLCPDCVPVVRARLAPRFDIRPAVVPDNARYIVTLFNGRSPTQIRTVTCDNPQRAQFLAETERPFNCTGYRISVRPADLTTN